MSKSLPARPYETDIKFTVASRAPKAHIYVALFAVAGDIVAVRAAIQLCGPADIYRIVGSTPNYQPTRKPTGSDSECVDDATWCYGDCSPNDCAYVAQKVKPDGTLARCKEKNTDGERSALEACPATCGTCP